MAKRKAKKTEELPVSDQLEDLAAVAGEANLHGALDDELRDACDTDADLAHEQITSEGLFEQLQFLYGRGYSVPRLREIIQDLKDEQK